jgi:hypothetical protein
MNKMLILLPFFFAGCATENDEPKFEPLPPEKLRDLRFICDGYAYKSITKKDYEQKEFN